MTFKKTLGKLLSGGLALAAISGPAVAGVGSTGGAGAVVCRDSGGSLRSARLLDLYEAEARYGLELLPSTGNLENDYALSVANTYRLQAGQENFNPEDTARTIQAMLSRLEFTGPLELLNDTGVVPSLPAGCAIEQLVIFSDREDYNEGSVVEGDRILVAKELWDAIGTLDRAAVISHELMYKYERFLGERSSEASRAAVAHMFSEDAKPVKEGLPAGAARFATVEWKPEGEGRFSGVHSKSSSFWVHPASPDSPIALQFFQIMGRPVLTQELAHFSGIKWNIQPAFVNGARKCLVAEKGVDGTYRAPLLGTQLKGFEAELEYRYGEEATLALYKGNALINKATVGFCK